jgi:hypothetical protein
MIRTVYLRPFILAAVGRPAEIRKKHSGAVASLNDSVGDLREKIETIKESAVASRAFERHAGKPARLPNPLLVALYAAEHLA